MKFEYFAKLKKGYIPVMTTEEKPPEEETDIKFVIEAKNRVTADRMVAALLKDAPNIEEYDGICIED